MKKIYFAGAFLLLSGLLNAQATHTFSGPRSVFNIPADGSGYTFFNLETGKQIAATDSATTNWHIAFNRTKMIFNSGNAGPGSVTGQLLNSDFMKTTQLPAAGYAAENTTSPIVPTGSGNGWYTYNPGNNVISANYDRSVAIKWGTKFALLQVVDYYQDQDVNKSSAHYTIRWQISNSVDVSQKQTRVNNLYAGYANRQFFNFASADSVPTADSNSTKWHVAFQTTTIYTNSGTSGPGDHELQLLNQNFDNVIQAPEAGYKKDQEGATAITTGSGNGWYNYDITVHSITPIANRTIIGRDGLGHHAKVVIKSYYKDAPANPTFLDIVTTKYYTFEYFFNPILSRNLDLSSNTTDINDLVFENNIISTYPNPCAGGELNIQTDKAGTSVNIVDINGRVIASDKTNAFGKLSFNTSNLTPGIYLVNNGKSSQKIIIQ